MQTLDSFVAATQLADRHAAAAESRAPTPPRRSFAPHRERVVLRRASHHDAAALTRLAQLDSAPRPSGEMLVAELDEQIVAAVPFDGGRAIADPFRPTAELVELLRAQAGSSRPAPGGAAAAHPSPPAPARRRVRGRR